MKFKLALAAAVTSMLLSACAGTTFGLHTTNSPVLGGTAASAGVSDSSAAIHAQVSPNTYFGLVILGYVMIGIQDSYLRWSDGFSSRKPPEMAEDRSVAERDCSQPLGPLYANLRCK